MLRTDSGAGSGVSANGYVVARKRAAISTDIQGRLVELCVEEGDRVKTGDLLARLDTRQLEAALARSEAEVDRERARAKLAKLNLERIQKLATSGDASPSEVDTARAELEEAEARIQSAPLFNT